MTALAAVLGATPAAAKGDLGPAWLGSPRLTMPMEGGLCVLPPGNLAVVMAQRWHCQKRQTIPQECDVVDTFGWGDGLRCGNEVDPLIEHFEGLR
jgi:hypothetical protein